MKHNKSVYASAMAVGILFTVGLACSRFGSQTPSNTTISTSNKTPAAATPSKPEPKNIAGDYDVSGHNPDGGGAYKINLKVTPRDDVYQFSWSAISGSYEGVGVMTDNIVAVSWTVGTNGKGCGVVLYKIAADGSLDGKAGYWGVNSAEKETAKRTSGTDLEGRYDVAGTNTEGKDYKGTLNVRKHGDGYTFTWNTGNTFEGFGIKTGDKVAVGFGGKQCSFVSYEAISDGTLEGKWGGQSSKTFGTEVAKKK